MRVIAPALIALLVALAAPFGRVASANDTQAARFGGVDRYSTAVAISSTFSPGVAAVYVAVGTNFPDALSGAAAAAAGHVPLLLVRKDAIPSVVAAELTRLAPARIVVLGGTAVIAKSVVAALRAVTSGAVQRLAGADRYATSAAISRATFAAGVPAVYVATGDNFPDALAGAAAAGHDGAPVLLVSTDRIPAPIAAELERLAPSKILVLGAPGAVATSVETALHAYTKGTVERVAGVDRYATAVAISRATYEKADTVYVATGLNFPDALAGAALGGPLLMTPPGALPDSVRDEILRLGAARVVALGGATVVSERLLATAAGLAYSQPTGRWVGNLYDPAAVRWQQPNPYACTAAAVLMMLNMIALQSPTKGEGFAWSPSVSYALQNEILAYERAHMTMVLAGTHGTDPHGWRNAFNEYGWGSLEAGVYRDEAFASFDDAVKAAIIGTARFGKPTGMLMLAGQHAELISGWDVTGEDPSTGSTKFAVNGVWLTDPWEPNDYRNTYVPLAWLKSGSKFLRFSPLRETDSPGVDPIDGHAEPRSGTAST